MFNSVGLSYQTYQLLPMISFIIYKFLGSTGGAICYLQAFMTLNHHDIHSYHWNWLNLTTPTSQYYLKSALLLERARRPSLHLGRLRTLATEVYKSVHQLNPPYVHDLYKCKTTNYHLRGHDTLVERGSSVGRMPDSQSREPGFESPLLPFRSLGIFFHFTTPQSTQLYK